MPARTAWAGGRPRRGRRRTPRRSRRPASRRSGRASPGGTRSRRRGPDGPGRRVPRWADPVRPGAHVGLDEIGHPRAWACSARPHRSASRFARSRCPIASGTRSRPSSRNPRAAQAMWRTLSRSCVVGDGRGGLAGEAAVELDAARRSSRARHDQCQDSRQVLTDLLRDLQSLRGGRVGARPVAETVGHVAHDVERLSQHAERSGARGRLDELCALAQRTLELARRQPPAQVESDEQRRAVGIARIERPRRVVRPPARRREPAPGRRAGPVPNPEQRAPRRARADRLSRVSIAAARSASSAASVQATEEDAPLAALASTERLAVDPSLRCGRPRREAG